MSISRALTLIVGTYFIVYPVFYFVYNFFIEGIGFPQYQIPGFWVGMAGYMVFNLIKNSIKSIFREVN